MEKTQFSCLKAVGVVQPKPAVLYKKGEFSNKFILILSGRAVITIGKEQMKLEAGSWHAFGTEVLDAMAEAIERSQENPDCSSVSLNNEISKNVNLCVTSYWDTTKKCSGYWFHPGLWCWNCLWLYVRGNHSVRSFVGIQLYSNTVSWKFRYYLSKTNVVSDSTPSTPLDPTQHPVSSKW